MRRDVESLTNHEFDLLIVGGGIYGATAAWDAALRGLKVALIEKDDFGSRTSSNSLKIIHGGLRYLQHADFARVRESITERRIMMSIAPHLVHPLPCIMPTKGHMMKGPEVMRIGLMMNDLFSFDRNKKLDRPRHLPNGHVVSKEKLFEIVPYLDRDNVNGGAMWYDAHMTNSERLLLSFIHSAVENGAVAANYIKATDFIVQGQNVRGVTAEDVLSGETLDIRAKMTITTAGPWINSLLGRIDSKYKSQPPFRLSTAMNLVVDKKLSEGFAFGAPSKKEFRDKDAVISKGSRLLFVVPWRGYSLVGTEHKPYHGDPDDFRVTEEDIQTFLDEVNTAVPAANLERKNVVHVLAGLLPMSAVNPETGDVTIEKHFKILDHEMDDGIGGLLSVLTVKYTTARGVSEQVVNKAVKKLNLPAGPSKSRESRIWGGEINNYQDFFTQNIISMNHGLAETSKQHLLNTYGSKYTEILKLGEDDSTLLQPLADDSPILRAEVVYGVREEMARSLADVIMRRTELGAAGPPSDAALNAAAEVMAKELQWDTTTVSLEIQTVKKLYQPLL